MARRRSAHDGNTALTPAGERLLAAASDLFFARGIRAVGVDLIAETAGTTKKTLYDCFGSKDRVVALYLERRAERWQELVRARLEARPGAPAREQVGAVFDALEEWLEGSERGCAFVNAYAELGATDHPALSVVRAEKGWMRRLFTSLVADEVDDPDEVASWLHLAYEGAVVARTAGGDPVAVEHGRRAAMLLLDCPA